MVTVTNSELFTEARRYIAGGVNSPVRSFKAVGGTPIFIRRAKGSKVYTEDEGRLIDYCLSWGALILGHSHPEVVKVLRNALKDGTTFGAPTRQETELARIITRAMPSIERLRLTNSGTEAVMAALRLARAFTGKDGIIRFAGSYHGHADYLLDCPGVPKDFTKYTVTLPYNDIDELKEALERRHQDIAAIIVEPIQANCGVILPRDGFLRNLRELADRYKILLVFDEVITGFRIGYGGAQRFFDVRPDLTCLGKIIGGGLPCGAYGGREEIMKLVAPEGSVYQAGTLAGNPLSVSAGIAVLKTLGDKRYYERLSQNTKKLCEGIKVRAKEDGLSVKVNYTESIFSIFFAGEEVVDYESAKRQDVDTFKRFYHGLLERGVYLSPSGFEANFLSIAHSANDIEKTLNGIGRVFENLRGNSSATRDVSAGS